MSEKAQNVQDVFLNHLRKNRTTPRMVRIDGVKTPRKVPSVLCVADLFIYLRSKWSWPPANNRCGIRCRFR